MMSSDDAVQCPLRPGCSDLRWRRHRGEPQRVHATAAHMLVQHRERRTDHRYGVDVGAEEIRPTVRSVYSTIAALTSMDTPDPAATPHRSARRVASSHTST